MWSRIKIQNGDNCFRYFAYSVGTYVTYDRLDLFVLYVMWMTGFNLPVCICMMVWLCFDCYISMYIYIYIYSYIQLYVPIVWLYDLYIYDRLRSAFGLKSASTPQIGIHWRHYLKSRPNLWVFSNQRPFQILRSMADLLGGACVIWSRFENLIKYIDLRYRCLWCRNQTWIWELDVD